LESSESELLNELLIFNLASKITELFEFELTGVKIDFFIFLSEFSLAPSDDVLRHRSSFLSTAMESSESELSNELLIFNLA